MYFNVLQIFAALKHAQIGYVVVGGLAVADSRCRARLVPMATNTDSAKDFTFADAERAQLRDWVGLGTNAKIDFFEEMIELAHRSGALAPERLALRDKPVRARVRNSP